MKKLFFLFLLIQTQSILAQNQNGLKVTNPIQSVIMQSPNVSSFSKYGKYPVELSTGLVKNEIPIYTIKTSKLELPISISYHSSGIKVNDIASSIGLGWTLNAGGMISIDARGHNDIGRSTEILTEDEIDEKIKKDKEGLVRKLSQICDYTDSESDLYSYNVGGGISGRFIYNNKNQLIQLPQTDNKIYNEINGNVIIIVSDNGTKYYFDKVNKSTTSVASDYMGNGGSNATTAYYLSKIESVDATDSIIFKYKNIPDYIVKSTNFDGFKISNTDLSIPTSYFNQHKTITYCTIQDMVLDKIIFNGGEVCFLSQFDRKDIGNGSPRISKILVNRIKQNNQTENILSCNFNHDYFESDDERGFKNKNPKYFYRLKLKSIELFSESSENIAKNIYKFIYNEKKLPCYDYSQENTVHINWESCSNYAQDLWGYYNGKTSNEHLIEYGNEVPLDDFRKMTTYNIPDRKVSEEFSKACILKGVIFPTGGFTYFDYEINKVNDNTIRGGLRVKKVASYDKNQVLLWSKEYVYKGGFDVSTNSYINGTSFYKKKLEVIYVKTNPLNLQDPLKSNETEIYTSTALIQSTINSNPVFYTEVEEYDNGESNGKKVYKFNFHENLIRANLSKGNSFFRYKQTVIDNFWMRGDLVSEETYALQNEKYQLIKSVNNEYKLFNLKKHVIGFVVTKDYERIFPDIMSNEPIESYNWFNTYISSGVNKKTKVIETDYINGIKSQQKLTLYEYGSVLKDTNSHLQPTIITNYINNDEYIRQFYKFPLDFRYETNIGEDYNNNKSLRLLNNISSPIEILKFAKRNNSEIFINGSFYRYNSVGNIIDMRELYPGNILDYKGSNCIDRNGYNINKNYIIKKKFEYDKKYNLIGVINDNGLNESYLWGYNSLCVLGKFENTSLEDLNLALQKRRLDKNKLLISMYPDLNEVNSLRDELPFAKIETYGFIPLRGISSITNNQNIKIEYEYDNLGRLSTVKENSKTKNLYTYNQMANEYDIILRTDSNYHQFRTAKFNVDVIDGSGHYNYKWTLKNKFGKILQSSDQQIFIANMIEAGELEITCEVYDTKYAVTKKIDRAINVSLPNKLIVSNINPEKNDFKVNGDTYNFSLKASQGSLEYSYKWELITPTQTILGKDSPIFSTKFEEAGQAKLVCIIEDKIYGDIIKKEYQFAINPPNPLIIESIYVNRSEGIDDDFRLYNVSLKENTGSSKYAYEWTLHTPTKTYTQNTKTFKFTYTEAGSHEISCIVSDLYTGQLFKIHKNIYIKRAIKVSNINIDNSSSRRSLTATINCDQDICITIKFGIDRPLSPKNDPVNFHIGGQFFSLLSGSREEQVQLKKGSNNIEIFFYKNSENNWIEKAWLNIIKVPAEYAITNDCLELNAL